MRMNTALFFGKMYAKKSASSAKEAMKALSAKTKKHVKKHKLKYIAGAGAAGGYTASKIKD